MMFRSKLIIYSLREAHYISLLSSPKQQSRFQFACNFLLVPNIHTYIHIS